MKCMTIQLTSHTMITHFFFKELIDNIKYVAESYNLLNADFLLALKAVNDDLRALFRKQHNFYANVDGNIIYVEKNVMTVIIYSILLG